MQCDRNSPSSPLTAATDGGSPAFSARTFFIDKETHSSDMRGTPSQEILHFGCNGLSGCSKLKSSSPTFTRSYVRRAQPRRVPAILSPKAGIVMGVRGHN